LLDFQTLLGKDAKSIKNKEMGNQNFSEIPCHPSQKGYCQEHKQQQMLGRIQGKMNPSHTDGGM
jgi:hypothetical protein